ncbi:MAG: metalloregulator ArsR/SmtB family transcription factor [Bacteroidales bacterium]|nr:metalloregulator ArsR/SmtB family transcription factor [Bacteroidales bacterium]
MKDFDQELRMKAVMFKALAHPARLAVLLYLARIKTCITGDIAEELPLSRTTVTQHLKELRDAGLIKGTIEGAARKYCLNAEQIKKLRVEFDELMEVVDTGISHC